MKRSSAPLSVSMLFVLLAAPTVLEAQSVAAKVLRSESGVELELRLDGYDGAEVLSTVSNRMRSQITFLVRVYSAGDMWFGLFGDRLIREYRVVREAAWDAFRRAYRVETRVPGDETPVERSHTRYFERKEEFLDELFQIEALRVAVPEGMEDLYALAQVRVTPVRLVPELRLISLFMSSNEIETSWHRIPIPAAAEVLE